MTPFETEAGRVREDVYQAREVDCLRKSQKYRWTGHAILAAVVIIGGGGIAMLARFLLLPPPIGRYTSAEMQTPLVYPTGGSTQANAGQVIITTTIERASYHRCRISKAMIVQFSDGSYRDGPGVRWARPSKDGSTVVKYSTGIPVDAPTGPATFWARDTYDCGVNIQTMETPHLPFTVMPAPELTPH